MSTTRGKRSASTTASMSRSIASRPRSETSRCDCPVPRPSSSTNRTRSANRSNARATTGIRHSAVMLLNGTPGSRTTTGPRTGPLTAYAIVTPSVVVARRIVGSTGVIVAQAATARRANPGVAPGRAGQVPSVDLDQARVRARMREDPVDDRLAIGPVVETVAPAVDGLAEGRHRDDAVRAL